MVLIGRRDEGPLRRGTLGKIVLMRLFSARAVAPAATPDHTTIDLGPIGPFL
ncbi:hypothetical protein [Burkholderia pseudomallei]|uniref:hypothetical protein n=1 Tax=Burkholderia pseudomallei TaxID=28450 RepID=UPI000B3186D2|nr:hypothetical protein [Burkholderia pseudomallei]